MQENVQQAITDYGQPIVIFIDDIDRLPPQEIRLLFQFIKAVGAFEGVSYVLAYDPFPVERALSFDGDLNGREYLKKLVQLPIKLPRISNLLLQRYFKGAIERLNSELSPKLSEDEQKILESCAAMPVVLRSLKTPRDVVRLFNVFRLRLHDCRGEVKLDELLVFVLLELVSPEAVELVRTHSSVFLAGLSYHPEFSALDMDGDTARLFQKEEELRTAKANLFEEILPANRDTARSLVDQLFSSSTHMLSQDARPASSPHGLIKLLYGGGSPLSFSIKEVEDFLQDRDRDRILDEKVAAGVLREWLIFASSISNLARIANPSSLADLLIAASLISSDEDRVHSIHRIVGEYLTELLELVDEKERSAFLDAIVNQRKNLAVAEDVLIRLARAAGLWANGQSFAIGKKPASPEWKNFISIEDIPELQKQWLNQVRSEAAADRLHQQPLLASILHRWGQFNENNYSEVQKYIVDFSAEHDPIIIFGHFPLANSLDGLEKIISDPSPIRAALKRYSEEPEFRKLSLKAVDHVEKKHKEIQGAERVEESDPPAL